jgi:hypothetical protein
MRMDNQIAAPCCGSCEWYCWNGRLLKYNCHNPEIVKQHKQNSFKPESLCQPIYYTPRNPSPLIAVPGVREIAEEAYREGYDQGIGDGPDYPENTDYEANYLNNSVCDYMKALEDNHE